MASSHGPPVILFGYDSSTFTKKVKMVLQLKRIEYTFVLVSSMMPRPLLVDTFNLTYRKIPVCLIGRELYIDTSLIVEALEWHFPPPSHPTIHPNGASSNQSTTLSPSNRTLSRLLSSYYTDRPLFRITTGLIPGRVWRTSFGSDRSELIGHALDPDKLEAKIPRNLAGLEMHLSVLEPLFHDRLDGTNVTTSSWMLGTSTPGLADISLYYQLAWGQDISSGKLVDDLTGGGTADTSLEGMQSVFSQSRFPGVWSWFQRVQTYFETLPDSQIKRIERGDQHGRDAVLRNIKHWIDSQSAQNSRIPMLPTPVPWNEPLDARSGVSVGAPVSIAPDDTGRNDPVLGRILALSAEEVVIRPAQVGDSEPLVAVRVHFPRLGFVIRPLGGSKEGTGAKL